MTDKPLTVGDLIRALSKLPGDMPLGHYHHVLRDDVLPEPHTPESFGVALYLHEVNGVTWLVSDYEGDVPTQTSLDFAPDANGQPFDAVTFNGVRVDAENQDSDIIVDTSFGKYLRFMHPDDDVLKDFYDGTFTRLD